MDANSENSKDAANQKNDGESKEKNLDEKQEVDGKSEAGTTEDDEQDNGEKENSAEKSPEKKENSEKVKEEKPKGGAAAAKKSKQEEKADPSAIPLGQIAKIDANITNTKADGLQTLHQICFNTAGKATMIKKNLRKFAGFTFDGDSDEYKEKLEAAQKHDVKLLRNVCDVLTLDKKGSQKDLAERICGFLLAPEGEDEPEEEPEEAEEEEAEEESEEEPRRSRKATTTTSGRPKRSTAGRGFNPDYSSSDESDERFAKTKKRKKEDSDSGSDYNPSGGGSDSDAGKRRGPPRGQRGRPVRRSKRQRSESEEESVTSEEESDEPKRGRGRRGRAAAAAATTRPPARKKRAQSDTEESDVESEESEKKVKKGGRVNKNNKTPGNAKSKTTTPSPAKGKGRPKRAAAKTKATKEQTTSEEEEEEEPELDDKEDASEDEPLAKKSKTTFPTDDEIKGYVKEILDDANLEEITMKTVCKQVYAKFPQFDLSHKKDFIKATVKSLIAT